MVFYRSVSLLSKLRNRVVQQPSLSNSVRWLQIQTSSDLVSCFNYTILLNYKLMI
ncbi:putative citrate synthase [Helianthus annuus]|nr:putative citrate synthase [Helianthus annuus]